MTREELITVFNQNSGVLSLEQINKFKIPGTFLLRMKNEGIIERPARNIYKLSDAEYDELHYLQLRMPYGVFSHETALFLNGLVESKPEKNAITIPRNKNVSYKAKEMCNVHYAKSEVCYLGMTEMKTEFGNKINVFDLERTICGIIKNRGRCGTSYVLKILNKYLASDKRNCEKLYLYAKMFSIDSYIGNMVELVDNKNDGRG